VTEQAERLAVEWGVAARCRSGETLNGDVAVIETLPDGMLVGAVDGLGHGREAARAARTAEQVVKDSPDHDLVALVERCHEAMGGTRGAAISLAWVSFFESRITWLGVGNVEGRVLSGDPAARGLRGSLALFNGVPGHQLPAMKLDGLDITPGDVLILATDGIAAGFADALNVSGSPQTISERIMARYRRASDDALVVAVRYLGRRP
jgi:negative regulator of sigma-B (phosphoserine phosphatase)